MNDPRQTEATPGEGKQPPSNETTDTVLEVRDLKKHFSANDGPTGLIDRVLGESDAGPVKAVDGVSFELHENETLGVVGESGCGKTTLGRSLLRLEDIDGGRVMFDGTDVTSLGQRDLKEWRRNAQMVYQNPTSSINERMTVGEVVREPLDVHGWKTPRERRERVSELLDRVGLRTEHYHRYPHQFSGGQRQRIGIARALALEPEFIVLDEPVSALDVSVQAKILNLLSDLQAEFDLTYMLIAHDLSVVRHICDRVGVMYLGKLMEIGPAEGLFQSPSNPYTRSLLSAIPRPDPGADTDRITLRGTPPNPRHPPSGCVFSTRCPFKIRPPEHEDLTEKQRSRIEEFRSVLRERERADITAVQRLERRFGLGRRFTPIGEVADELFGPVEYPEAVRESLDRATRLVAEGNVAAARELLASRFGTVCETEAPALHQVGEGQVSRCHRHRAEYAEPEEYRRDADEFLPQ